MIRRENERTSGMEPAGIRQELRKRRSDFLGFDVNAMEEGDFYSRFFPIQYPISNIQFPAEKLKTQIFHLWQTRRCQRTGGRHSPSARFENAFTQLGHRLQAV